MMFQGIPNSESDHWKDGTGRFGESKKGNGGSPTMWRDVVGVEAVDKHSDEKLFRVVEWAGIEVLKERIR
ncbi:hypothetical protein M407DRAFT_241570 [Tulasnella calospora MUT 4182]|uniref:Uncharacterized protein n=1 Tax=Tulasnella calospora MUT 4182 TaxID=1051891 RepID=A0A0C3QJ00_9AGAM|nr:hypothetical protein M407DRAFT_241570 [Tulasnella calospora MUT 4182]